MSTPDRGVTVRHITLDGGPLAGKAILQPTGTLRLYHVALGHLEALEGRLPSSVHRYEDPGSYPKRHILVVMHELRPTVEQLLSSDVEPGDEATLIGCYMPDVENQQVLRWHPALSQDQVRELNSRVHGALALGVLNEVERIVSEVSDLISPEYYANLFGPVMNAFVQGGRTKEAKTLATIILWGDPDLPSARRVLEQF